MYVKLFGSILESSIWSEDHATVRVWIAMLAMADQDGVVWAAVPGLARRANVTADECRRALDIFLAPDPYSRTPEYEGRRIEVVEGGWRLLNYQKYREIQTREQMLAARRMRRYRERNKRNSDVTPSPVTPVTPYAEAEAKGDVEAKHTKNNGALTRAPCLSPTLITETLQGQRSATPEVLDYLAGMVLAYANITMGHRWPLTAKLRSTLRARLKFYGCNPAPLLYATDAVAHSPYHMGQNDTATEYNHPSSYLRNDDRAAQWAEKSGRWRAGEPHPFIPRYLEEVPPNG